MLPDTSMKAEFAIRALRAVFGHPDFELKRVDERPIETFLVALLNHVPEVAADLFGCGLDVLFGLGAPGSQADVVGWSRGEVVVECEVKIDSEVNWSEKKQAWQLDTAVANAPSATFFLLTWDRRELVEELERWRTRGYPVRSLDRWTVLRCGSVLETLDRVVGPALAATDSSVEYLACLATRLEGC
jgi:hypothetical protein